MGIYQIHATSSMEGNRDTATKLKACVKLQKKKTNIDSKAHTVQIKKESWKIERKRHIFIYKKGKLKD